MFNVTLSTQLLFTGVSYSFFHWVEQRFISCLLFILKWSWSFPLPLLPSNYFYATLYYPGNCVPFGVIGNVSNSWENIRNRRQRSPVLSFYLIVLIFCNMKGSGGGRRARIWWENGNVALLFSREVWKKPRHQSALASGDMEKFQKQEMYCDRLSIAELHFQRKYSIETLSLQHLFWIRINWAVSYNDQKSHNFRGW